MTPDRNLSTSTQRRDEKRTPEELSILKLARCLETLADEYPRFRAELFKLQAYVRNQLQSLEAKQIAILRVFELPSAVPMDVDELVTDTRFDHESVRAALAALVRLNRIEEINRDANPPRKTRSGRFTDHVYYRLRPARRSASQPTGKSQAAFSSTE